MKKYLKVNFVPGPNFGDLLFPYMLNKLYIPFVWTHHDIEYKIISTGSIIGVGAKPNTIVWGSGIITRHTSLCKKSIYKAIRGPECLKKLNNPDNVAMGDPGLLLSDFYNPETDKKHKLGIIPHVINYDIVKKFVDENKNKFKNTIIINPNIWVDGIENYIDQVNSCEKIISTSLHGLITAHSYNIPAKWWKIKEGYQLMGDDIKFKEYFRSVGYGNIDPVFEITDEIEMKGFINPNKDIINKIKRELHLSCPLYNLNTLNEKYFTTLDNYKQDCYVDDYHKSGKKYYEPGIKYFQL